MSTEPKNPQKEMWWQVAESFFASHGPTDHKLNSFNEFMREKLHNIITNSEMEYTKDGVKYFITFDSIVVKSPEVHDSNVNKTIKPYECRIRNLSYHGKVYGNVNRHTLSETGQVLETETKKVFLGNMPIMVKSNFCNLVLGKDVNAQVYKNYECPNDPGGYFYINGNERVLMPQDRMAHNEIFVFKIKETIKTTKTRAINNVKKKRVFAWSAEVRSYSDHAEPNITTTFLKLTSNSIDRGEDPRLYIEIPYLKEETPWPVLFMALGVETREEMISYVCDPNDKELIELLGPSLDLPRIKTQQEALEYLSEFTTSIQKEKKFDQIKYIIKNKLFQNVPNTFLKRHYLGHMTFLLLSTVLGRRNQDDRDHYSKKRIDTDGTLINNLFKGVWKRTLKDAKTLLEKKRNIDINKSFHGKITNPLKTAFATGNWTAGKTAKSTKVGISQILNRHNYISTLSNLRRVHTPSDKNNKIIKPRHLHSSHFYYLCPFETPEGQPVGLIRNLSALSTITLGSSEEPILDWLRIKKVVVLDDIPSQESEVSDIKPSTLQSNTKIFINGRWVGVVLSPDGLVDDLKKLRRDGKIPFDVSISQVKEGIRIFTDEGRLIAPYLVVKDSKLIPLPSSTGGAPEWKQLLESGVIEYLDVAEVETLKISVYPWELDSSHTHSIIHPQFLVGVSAGTTPFFNHNQAPRVVYQCLWKEEPVLMADYTLKKIKDVKVGDQVITFDPETMKTSTTNVINAQVSATEKKIVKITTEPDFEYPNGREIIATCDHKFMTDKGWVEAQYLENRYVALLVQKNTITFVPVKEVTPVNNVEIADITTESENHSFIGGSGFMVHNSAMSKQALGVFAHNFLHRYDTSSHILCYPQIPLTNSNLMKYLGSEKLPAGQNHVVAVACHGGYNQEDSIIPNKSAIDMGAFRSVNYCTYDESNRKKGNTSDEIRKPEKLNVRETNLVGYNKLDIDGIPKENTPLSKRDIVIGKVTTTPDMVKDASVTVKINGMEDNSVISISEDGREIYDVYPGSVLVDQALLTINEDSFKTVKVRTCQLRIPQIGDKLASRSAQKGIIGLVPSSDDLPFNEDGINPTLIMNPNAYPSRMTIAQSLESHLGKCKALEGKLGDTTPFENSDKVREEIYKMLEAYEFQKYGDEILRNGETGEVMPYEIYMGVVHYQRLKHMVDDKIHSRDQNGPRETLTRQPVEGRKRGGGFRVGEMETQCLASHGAATFIIDRLVDNSDGYDNYVCDYCGNTAIANLKNQTFECKRCEQTSAISKVRIPYAFKLLQQELMASGIGVWTMADMDK